MKPFNLTVLLFCLVTYGYGRPSTNEESDEISRDAKKDKYFQQYRLPYWAIMPTLGVWPGADGTGTRTKGEVTATAAKSLLASKSVAVNLDNGKVTVVDGVDRPEVTADAVTPVPGAASLPAASRTDPAADYPKRRKPTKTQLPNTPSVGGPSWLRRKTTTTTTSTEMTTTAVRVNSDDSAEVTAADNVTAGPITRIYLKPSARAKAGTGGVALSNPISTAVVRRGDTVRIEYLPDATAEAGEGGVAISRPELIIHFVD